MSGYNKNRPKPGLRSDGQELTFAQAKASGYCVISRSASWAARIDKPDWREALAATHIHGMTWVTSLPAARAADTYRRSVSKDRIRVPASWMNGLENSSDGGPAEYLPLADRSVDFEVETKSEPNAHGHSGSTTTVILCDYCGKPAELTSGATLYRGRQDLASLKFWMCWKCDAYVGCHQDQRNGTTPLGRLANAELRKARRAVHDAFDPLWKYGRMSRTEAYQWLARALSISMQECHIGMFDECRCGAAMAALHRLEELVHPPLP